MNSLILLVFFVANLAPAPYVMVETFRIQEYKYIQEGVVSFLFQEQRYSHCIRLKISNVNETIKWNRNRNYKLIFDNKSITNVIQ